MNGQPRREKRQKRERERLIQAWFDPEGNDDEQYVLSVESYFREQNKSPKEIITMAFLALGYMSENSIPVPMPKVQKSTRLIGEIHSLVAEVLTLIKNGKIAFPDGSDLQRRVADTDWDMNAIEEAIADQYRPLNLDDE